MKDISHLTIAIDGYSSSGKSTLARELADCLSLLYVDSGAMYRAVTLYFIEKDVKMRDPQEVSDTLKEIHISFTKEQGKLNTYLNGRNVSKDIRSIKVSSYVSEIAAIPEVRTLLVDQQRAMQQEMGIVMDGRDIGTVVFPDADVKLFVTADLDVRIERRYKELSDKGMITDRATVRKNLEERDYLDSHRDISPLKMAEDSILLDNTHLNRQEQLSKSLDIIRSKFPDVIIKDC